MARGQGNQKETADPVENTQDHPEEGEAGGRLPGLPELARRALSLGLSGFFLTEETIRKALGDTLPRDWTDFAIEQSERTRKEFLERLSYELAQMLEQADLAALMRELLEGRTLEIRAEIRLGGQESGPDAQNLKVAIQQGEGET
jgi:hypothetical protein